MIRLDIGGTPVGDGAPCFVIAEAGVNHNGDLGTAKQLVEVAAQSGADAVKFQTFKAELLAAPDAPKAEYQAIATGIQESHYDMLKRLELAPDAYKELQDHCRDQDIIFISSPFDHDSVDLLDSLDVPAFKVPSGETVNLGLLRYMASKGKPIILSTGMCYLGEVEQAIRAVNQAGNESLVVLHCVSNYPASPGDVNLRAMSTIANAFNVLVGFSDHTMGIEIPMAAVALGACVLEKHFTLDREMSGPDHRASLEPDELRAMVNGIRRVEQAIGMGIKQPVESESNTREVARRSIYMRRKGEAGSILVEDDLVALRPAGGISPEQIDAVMGRTLRRSLPTGTALSWGDLK